MKIYIVSYGGSGSWLLVNYLKELNLNTYHIHSRIPPKLICDVPKNSEHFNYNKLITEGKIIFIYRKPIYSLMSRKSSSITHFENIGVNEKNINILKNLGFTRKANQNPNILKKYLNLDTDIINYENFFDNYYNCTCNENYELLCVNFDNLWTHIEEICKFVGKEYNKNFPIREKRSYDENLINISNKLFNNLNNKIDSSNPIKILNKKS